MTSSSISVPLSILDLAQIPEGGNAQTALHRSRELAQHAERLGYNRFWLAEHHNMAGIASAATSVAIGFVAEGTSTIRVGAGGVMLPNHAPLVIAEQFGTLEALYPGRIDLGLGRAPGTDQPTMRALRRDFTSADTFPQDVQELQALLGDAAPDQHIQAVPGQGSHIPLWILGSSLFGAQLAAALGLPYAFASHFAPAALVPGDPGLPRALPAFRAAGPAVRDARGQRDHRRHRRGGAQARHLAAEVVHRRRVPPQAHAAAAADRQHRRLLAPAGEGAAGVDAELLVHRVDRDRRRSRSRASSPSTSRTS